MMLNRPAPVDASREGWAEESAALRREFAAIHRLIAQINFMLGAMFVMQGTTLGILIAKLYF